MELKSFLIGFLLAACLSIFIILGVSCGSNDYDYDKYREYMNNGELSDVVHEWMHAYIEGYCRIGRDGSI